MRGGEGRVREEKFLLEVKTMLTLSSVKTQNIRDQFPFNSSKHISSAHSGQAPGTVLGTGDPAANKTDLVPAS